MPKTEIVMSKQVEMVLTAEALSEFACTLHECERKIRIIDEQLASDLAEVKLTIMLMRDQAARNAVGATPASQVLN